MEFNENVITEETKKVAAIDEPVKKVAFCEVAGRNGLVDRVLGFINVKYCGDTAYVSKADCDKIRRETKSEYIVLDLPPLYDDAFTVVEIDGDIY